MEEEVAMAAACGTPEGIQIYVKIKRKQNAESPPPSSMGEEVAMAAAYIL
jgi:hypothetical protein